MSSSNINQTVSEIIEKLKRDGIFDAFRKECLADVDSKPAYQSLRYRVEGAVTRFLDSQRWHVNLNKNQLRESLRKHIVNSPFLLSGIDDIINQIVRSKITKIIKPQIDVVVRETLELQQSTFSDANKDDSYNSKKIVDEKLKEENVTKRKPEPITVEDLLNVGIPKEKANNVAKVGSCKPLSQVESKIEIINEDTSVDMELDDSQDGTFELPAKIETEDASIDASDMQLSKEVVVGATEERIVDDREALITSDGDIMYVVDSVEEEVYEEGAEELMGDVYTAVATTIDSESQAIDNIKETTDNDGESQTKVRFQTTWDDWNANTNFSDVSVSSVHTSDLSSFDEDNKSQEDEIVNEQDESNIQTETRDQLGEERAIKNEDDRSKKISLRTIETRETRRQLRRAQLESNLRKKEQTFSNNESPEKSSTREVSQRQRKKKNELKQQRLEQKVVDKRREKQKMQEDVIGKSYDASMTDSAQVLEFNAYLTAVDTAEDGMETVTVEVAESTNVNEYSEQQEVEIPGKEGNDEIYVKLEKCSRETHEALNASSPTGNSDRHDRTPTEDSDRHSRPRDRSQYSRNQRYDESDLYKPRLQLHSSQRNRNKRERVATSPAEDIVTTPINTEEPKRQHKPSRSDLERRNRHRNSRTERERHKKNSDRRKEKTTERRSLDYNEHEHKPDRRRSLSQDTESTYEENAVDSVPRNKNRSLLTDNKPGDKSHRYMNDRLKGSRGGHKRDERIRRESDSYAQGRSNDKHLYHSQVTDVKEQHYRYEQEEEPQRYRKDSGRQNDYETDKKVENRDRLQYRSRSREGSSSSKHKDDHKREGSTRRDDRGGNSERYGDHKRLHDRRNDDRKFSTQTGERSRFERTKYYVAELEEGEVEDEAMHGRRKIERKYVEYMDKRDFNATEDGEVNTDFIYKQERLTQYKLEKHKRYDRERSNSEEVELNSSRTNHSISRHHSANRDLSDHYESRESSKQLEMLSSPSRHSSSKCDLVGWIEDCYGSPSNFRHSQQFDAGVLRSRFPRSSRRHSADEQSTEGSIQQTGEDESGEILEESGEIVEETGELLNERRDSMCRKHRRVSGDSEMSTSSSTERLSMAQRVMTRSIRKQSEEELLPPAKRLRSCNR